MTKKTKSSKSLDLSKEEAEVRTFKPMTYIKYIKKTYGWNDYGPLKSGHTYLFLGWITNATDFGDNAVLLDDRGVFTASIREEDFEDD